MNDAIPPKHKPSAEPPPDPGSNMLSVYQAAQTGGGSFPVLEAFQKFIEQERAQARKKMFQLYIIFAVLLQKKDN